MSTTSPNQIRALSNNLALPDSPDSGREVYQFTGKLASLALAAKAKKGECIGPAPTGYVNMRRGDVTWVEIDPKVGPLVREAFELATKARTSIRQILAALTPKGLVSRDGKPMGPSALLNILTNPFYIGLIRHQDQLYPGTHPPLVSRSVFERVQERLGQRRRSTVVIRNGI